MDVTWHMRRASSSTLVHTHAAMRAVWLSRVPDPWGADAERTCCPCRLISGTQLQHMDVEIYAALYYWRLRYPGVRILLSANATP